MKNLPRRPSTSSRQTPLRRKLLAVLVAACYSSAHAGPLAPSVVAGQASFSQQGKTYTITNTPNTIINWQGFSLATDEIAKFVQQGADSRVLNRIAGQDPSVILGAIQSNGKVFLINPNGVLFGAGAQVDVNGLVASSLALSNSDFLAGKNNFSGSPDAGKVSNAGSIRTPAGGQVFLIAPSVENRGIISTDNGQVVLAAGHSVQLFEAGDPNLQVVVSAAADQALNLGQIVAQGGRIGVYGALVNQRGRISADSAVRGANGKIVLKSSGTTLLEAGSTTTARGSNLNVGGDIMLLGPQVGLTGNAVVDASGATGGGTVLLGGDYQGRNPAISNARQSYVGKDSVVRADALDTGNGGKLIVWSDENTRMYGSLSARGGAHSGDGGLVETSGHVLDMRGQVDTRAPQGKTGSLLLDPGRVVIADEAATAINRYELVEDVNQYATLTGSGPFAASNVKGDSFLATGVLHDALMNNDVTVTTRNSTAASNGQILLLSSLAWSSNKALTLDAEGNIDLQAAITAANGGLHLIADGAIAQSTNQPEALSVKSLSAIALGGINLNNSANQITDAVTLQSTNDAVNILAQSLNLGSGHASGIFSANAADGNLTLANGATLSSSSQINLSAYGSGGNLTIGSGASLSSSGAIYLTVSDTGAHRISNAGEISGEGIVRLTAGQMTLAGGSIQGYTVSLNTANAINIGATGNAANTLELSASDLSSISNSLVTVESTRSAAAGNIVVSAPLSIERSLELTTTGGIALNAAVTLSGGGNLTLTAGDDQPITASGNLSIGGTLAINRGNWSQISATLPSLSAGGFTLGDEVSFIRALSGSGSSGSPYQLADVYGLQGVASLPMSNWYTLANDINAAGTASWNDDAGFKPIASSSHPYTGTFDGNGHSISGLTIHRNDDDNIGLFAQLGAGTLRNLTLSGGSIIGSEWVGALVGQISADGLVSNVHSSAAVSGDATLGGLVGRNDGTVTLSSSSGNVTGIAQDLTADFGGLVGTNGGTISYSSASGIVETNGVNTGGLVGLNVYDGGASLITNSYATGYVHSTYEIVGGLVGDNLGGIIRTSYATGNVNGGRDVGGLVGRMYAQNGHHPVIENAYATGNLVGNLDANFTHANMGGVVGEMWAGSVSKVFYTGHVDGTGFYNNVRPLIGAAIEGSSEYLYYDSTTAGVSGGVGIGLSTAQMRHASNFVGFEFTNSPAWRIYEGHTLPMLKSLLTPLTVTVTGGSSIVKTYDGQSATLVGASTSLPASGVSGTLGWDDKKNAGTYGIGGLYSSQYDITYAGNNPQLVINPREVTASVSAQKVYDGYAAVSSPSQYTFTLQNVVAADSGIGMTGEVAFADKNVGNAKPLTVSGPLLQGNTDGNYLLTGTVNGFGNITPRPLAFTDVSLTTTRQYNGNDLASFTGGQTIAAGLNSDDVHLASTGTAIARYNNKNVGENKPVTFTLSGYTLSGADAGNYVAAGPSGLTADITPAPITLSGLTANSRVYNLTLDTQDYTYGTLATLNTSNAVIGGLFGSDVVHLVSATGSFSDRNVGSGKTVTGSSATLGGAEAGNYQVLHGGFLDSMTASITPAPLTLTLAPRQYNNSTTASFTNAVLNGILTDIDNHTDVVNLVTGSATASYADKNVGVAKAVTVAGGALSLNGAQAGNYALSTDVVGTITARPTSTWVGSGGGLWSTASNWADSIAPDGANVLAATIGSSAGTITYDASAGNTTLTTMSVGSGSQLALTGGALTITGSGGTSSLSGATLNLNGGSLVLNGDMQANTLTLASGVLSGTNSAATLTLYNLTQTNGSVDMSGSLNLYSSGPITIGNVRAQHGITLNAAENGTITQTGALVTDSLQATAANGIALTNSGNHVGAFTASNAQGSILLNNTVNSGALMLGTLTTHNGNIVIDNHGGIVVNGHAHAYSGNVSIAAHSPVTINDQVDGEELIFSASTAINLGSGAALNAVNSIQLTAGTDIVLGGSLTLSSGSGSIALTATNGNISVGSATAISSNGGSVNLSAPLGSVASGGISLGSNTNPVIDSGAAAAAAAQAAAAAEAAAKAAADAAAKAAADAAAKAAAEAAAKAAAEAAAKAAADAAAKAAADAAAQAAADAAAKAAADAAAKAAAEAAAKAAADAAAKAAADAAAKAAADAAAAKAAADAAAQAAADAAAKAAADAAAKAAADAASGGGNPNAPVSQVLNSTVNLINSIVPQGGSVPVPPFITPQAGSAPASSSAAPAGGGGNASTVSTTSSTGAASTSTTPDDKKDDKPGDKTGDKKDSKESAPAKDAPVKKTYCN